MRNDTFSWIHLSDLHLRSSTRWDSDRVIQALFEDLKKLSKELDFIPDAVFFTGDATFGTFEGEDIELQFRAFGEFLDGVRNCFDEPLPKERIYLIPGNHDVDRSRILGSDTEYLRNPNRHEDEIIDELRRNGGMCSQWMTRLHRYREFLRNYGLEHLSPDNHAFVWANKITKGDRSVGIAGFNSAWSCASNQEKSKLWMGGRWQVGEVLSKLGKVDISFALVHHPSGWLNEYEDPIFERYLESSFDVMLHGHEHQDFVTQLADGYLKISAGACYDRSTREKGYSIGVINIERGDGEIRPRVWDGYNGWVSKNIARKAPNGIISIETLRSRRPGELSSSGRPDQIISVGGPPSEVAVKAKLLRLRRRPFVFQPAHTAVRFSQRKDFEAQLASGGIGWLVADWQMGREGLIAGVLNNLGSKEALDNVYRIDCGDAVEVDEIFEDASSQLGVSFTEFVALMDYVEQPTLILEDLSVEILRDEQSRSNLFQKLSSTLEFNPSLRIIVTTRQWLTSPIEVEPVTLHPLDEQELLRYLKFHKNGKRVLRRVDRLDDILAATSGLPAAIDNIIQKSRILPVEKILDNYFFEEQHGLIEKMPRSLQVAVDKIFAPQDDDGRRKLALFKLLTILKDGETFEALRRAFPRRPFKDQDIYDLDDDALIESISVVPPVSDFLPSRMGKLSFRSKEDRLLRVPRQVRDYASKLITKEEKTRIFNAVSEALFGIRWYEGSIKLRRAIVLAYRESTVAGPGNELLVAQFLLKGAIDRGIKERVEKYSQLAVGYCTALMNKDRFRDAVIASRAILSLLDENLHSSSWITCSHIFGRCLRMTSKHEESIEVLEKLSNNSHIKSKEFKAEIYMSLAWSYNSIGNEQAALKNLELVFEYTKEESATWFEASAEFAEIRLKGDLLDKTLRSLFVRSKRLNHRTAANNIALTIARKTATKEEAIELYDGVIVSAKDLYNQTRAIINKADLLRKDGAIDSLSRDEQLRLCDAYEYSCTQRITNLVDSCHDALWEFCINRSFWNGLFRLFRYSSYTWCFSGEMNKETKYILYLVEVRDDPKKIQREEIEIEVEYLERRLASQMDIDETSEAQLSRN